jgi:aminoglycoside phosphotransferase (APT) family kinase protein
MTDPNLERLIQIIAPGAQLLGTWPLLGGSSAQMTPFEIALPDGETRKLVLRRSSDFNYGRNPQAVADEYRLLEALGTMGVPTPKPFHLDQSGGDSAIPFMVIQYLEGEADYGPVDKKDAARQLADCLAKIHAIDGACPSLAFLREQTIDLNIILNNTPKDVDKTLYIERIVETLEPVLPPPQANPPALLHGDFWPGNILWKDGQLTAVIDWEDAARGDPLSDLAISRLDLRMIYGPDAMTAFTRRYIAATATDTTALPYWDLHAALRSAPHIDEWGENWSDLGRDDITADTMKAAYRSFVEEAFKTLGAGD